MKLAISGKGGVGKTTFAAVLARLIANDGGPVVAIDADLDSNLASALGVPVPKGLRPIIEMKELIEERTEAGPRGYGKLFKLNPTVSDIPEKYSIVKDGVRLMILGPPKRGGTGCACPENVFLKNLLAHLVLQRDEALIVDLEAGIEHLGRATCQAIDALIVVVEPGRRSVQTAESVRKMAKDIGVRNVFVVGNKVRSEADLAAIREALPHDLPFLGAIGYDERLVTADLQGRGVAEVGGALFEEVKAIRAELVRLLK